MSIIRVCHNHQNPYVQINKRSLWDEDLTLEAVGLWARLLSKPDNFQVSVANLAKKCKLGPKSIYRILRELEKHGYAYRCQSATNSGEKGFSKVETYIFEFKASKEDVENMITEGQIGRPLHTHCGALGRFALSAQALSAEVACADLEQKDPSHIPSFSYKEKGKEKKREGKEKGLPPPAPPPPQSPPLFEYVGIFSGKQRVTMLQAEHEKLVQTYGEDLVRDFLERLDGWADDNPKKFAEKKSHAATLNKWIRDHLAEKKIRSASIPAFAGAKFPPSKAELERQAKCSAEKLRDKYPNRVYIGTDSSSMKAFISMEKPRRLVLGAEAQNYVLFLDDANFVAKLKETCEKWGIDTNGIV